MTDWIKNGKKVTLGNFLAQEKKPMHTPTPWTLKRDRADNAHSFEIESESDNSRSGKHCVAALTTKPANAAFIVTACNAHEDFINVLKATLEDFAAERLIGDPETVEATIEQIKKALAKAGMKESV